MHRRGGDIMKSIGRLLARQSQAKLTQNSTANTNNPTKPREIADTDNDNVCDMINVRQSTNFYSWAQWT